MMKMMKTFSMIVLALSAALGLAACATALTTPPSAAVDVTGRWVGGWKASTRSGELILTLKQDGLALSGTLTNRGTLYFGDGEVPIRDVTLSGNRLSFSADSRVNASTLTFEVSVDGDTMSGELSYRAFDHIAVSLKRQK